MSDNQHQVLTAFFGRKGLVIDRKLTDEIHAWNSSVKEYGVFPVGTRIMYYSPTLVVGQVMPDETFDMSMADKYQLGTERTTAHAIRTKTLQMPNGAYEQIADMVAHRRLVASIDKTAMLVESRADKLTAKDLALTKYYLSEANMESQRLYDNTNAFGGVPTTSVEQLKLSVQPLEHMQLMMGKTGQPIEYRSVNVTVSTPTGEPPAAPMRVYVLPGGVIDRPETYSLQELKRLLIALSFEKLTSPSRSAVGQGDMRIWIGPDHAYDAMAKWVLQNGPIRFKPVLPASFGSPEPQLEFTSPTDVVQP